MQEDFEKNWNDFFTQVKTHFDSQNKTLAEYEQFFVRAKEAFPLYADFVEQVNRALTSIHAAGGSGSESRNESVTSQKPLKSPRADVNLSSRLSSSDQKKIMIVDDAEINRVLMGHFFKNMPVTLVFANSGEQAIEKISQHAFDLILMDLQMKGLSGVETIKEIRALQPQHSKKTRMVAISNQSPTPEERQTALEAGANEYLSRSMPREVIREKVFEILLGDSSQVA